jgi:hypothetical protein
MYTISRPIIAKIDGAIISHPGREREIINRLGLMIAGLISEGKDIVRNHYANMDAHKLDTDDGETGDLMCYMAHSVEYLRATNDYLFTIGIKAPVTWKAHYGFKKALDLQLVRVTDEKEEICVTQRFS